MRIRVVVEGQLAILEVKDTGCGMSEEFVRERLFRRSRRPSRPEWASAPSRLHSWRRRWAAPSRRTAGRGQER